jgi:CRISPR-associated protein Csb2
MLAVEIELLTDRYVATHFNDRSSAEWPPHPARLYSAMVATWADDDEPDETERDALARFAALGAPVLTHSDARPREAVTHYVPVNDAAVVRDLGRVYGQIADAEAAHVAALEAAGGDVGEERVQRAAKNLDKHRAKAVGDSRKAGQAQPGAAASGLAVLPDQRGKQGRFYPSVVPDSSRFYFVWPDADLAEEHRVVLDGLLARVSRLGHSSSFVACRLVEVAPPPTLVPDPAGADAMLRVTTPGLLERLETAYEGHQGREPRALPARMARYAAVDPAARAAVPAPHLSGSWIVLVREAGPVLPVRRSLMFARGVRDALLHHAEQPVPELLSGHVQGPADEPTAPTTRPHLAVVPLPFVGGGHGDGSLLGVALILPADADLDGDRQVLLRAVGRWREDGFTLRLGPAGLLRLAVADPADTRSTLDRRTWCRPSRQWVSATPVALDRHPGDLWSARADKRDRAHTEAGETIMAACDHAGLPRPVELALSREPLLRGTEPAPRYDAFAGGRGPRRFLVHASLTFEEPVGGPVLIGAGRFLGYGLFRPMRGRRSDDADPRP